MGDARIFDDIIRRTREHQRHHDGGKAKQQHIMNAVNKPGAQAQRHDDEDIAHKARVFLGGDIRFRVHGYVVGYLCDLGNDRKFLYSCPSFVILT